MDSLSDETKYMINYWLRGVRKGFSVDLSESMGYMNFTPDEQRKVIRELHEISASTEDLDLLLTWGLGLPREVNNEVKE